MSRVDTFCNSLKQKASAAQEAGGAATHSGKETTLRGLLSLNLPLSVLCIHCIEEARLLVSTAT